MVEKTFGSYLRSLLGEKERRPAWLARKLGCSDSTVSRWLSGKTKPRPPYKTFFAELAEALDLSLIEQQQLEALLHPKQNNYFLTPSKVFVGRSEELNTLHTWLSRESHSRIYGIVGAPGMGKTTLAQQVCHMAATQLDKLPIVIRCGNHKPQKYLEQIAHQLDFTPHFGSTSLEYSKYLHQAMAFYDVLLILDDVHMLNVQNLRYVMPPLGTCPVLVTTNRLDWPPIQHTDVIRLQALSPVDTLMFFAIHIGATLTEANRKHLLHLAGKVGHIPLILKFVADLFIQEKSKVQPSSFSDQTNHIGALLETLISDIQQDRFWERFGTSPTIEKIIQTIETLPSDSRHLLDIATIFKDSVDEHILRITSKLGPNFDTALLRLINQSCISQTGLQSYRVNRIIKLLRQKVLRNKPSGCHIPIRLYIQSFHNTPQVKKADALDLIDWLYHCGHIQEAVDLSLELFDYLHTKGQIDGEIQNLLTRALQFAEDMGAERAARVYLQLGMLHMRNIRLTASRSYLEKGQEITDIPALQSALAINLGKIALYENHFDAAVKSFRGGLHIAQKHEMRELGCYASSYLGLWAACEGKYPYAEECYKSALHITEALQLACAQVSILARYGNLLCNQRNFDYGIQKVQRALQIAQKHGCHEQSISPLSVLTTVYIEAGNLAAAKLYLQRALHTFQRLQRPCPNYLLYLVTQLEQDEFLFVHPPEQEASPFNLDELKDILLFY